jgi:flagellar FliL protein
VHDVSDAKKKPAPEAEASNPEAAEGEETPKKKGLGLVPMVIAAVVAAGVAGGAAFVLAPTGGGEDHAESADGENAGDDTKDGHGEPKKKKKEKKGGDHGGGEGGESTVKPVGEIQYADSATFLVLEPMIVSIPPIGRSKHLKVSLVLETDEDGAEILLDHGYYIQDVLNTFLRSVDASVLEDPASMSRLRAQILRRIRAIVPDAEVQNVLITEFVLT